MIGLLISETAQDNVDAEDAEEVHVEVLDDESVMPEFETADEIRGDSFSSSDEVLEDSPETSLYDEGILGLARIIVYRKKSKFPELQATAEDSSSLGTTFPAWVEHFSQHGHATPTRRFHHQVLQMDSVFLTIHKKGLDRDKDVIKRFRNQVAKLGLDLPVPVVEAFGKLRLDVRLRVFNQRKNKSKKAVLEVNAKEKWDKNSRTARKVKDYMLDC